MAFSFRRKRGNPFTQKTRNPPATAAGSPNQPTGSSESVDVDATLADDAATFIQKTATDRTDSVIPGDGRQVGARVADPADEEATFVRETAAEPGGASAGPAVAPPVGDGKDDEAATIVAATVRLDDDPDKTVHRTAGVAADVAPGGTPSVATAPPIRNSMISANAVPLAPPAAADAAEGSETAVDSETVLSESLQEDTVETIHGSSIDTGPADGGPRRDQAEGDDPERTFHETGAGKTVRDGPATGGMTTYHEGGKRPARKRTPSSRATVGGLIGGMVEEKRGSRIGGELVENALNSGFPAALLKTGLLPRNRLRELLFRAQTTGETFFHAVIRNSDPQMVRIFDWLHDSFGWELIRDEETLSSQAIATDWLPFDKAADKGVVVLKSEEIERLRYATLDPFDLALHDWMRRCADKPCDRVIVTPKVFVPTLRRLKNAADVDEKSVGIISIDFSPEEDAFIRDQIGEVDVPRMVDYFLFRAHAQGASDIHIEPTEKLLMVRNRLNGILHAEISLPIEFHPETVSRLKILCNMDVAEKRRPQDGRLSVVIRNSPIDVRVSSYPTVFGEKFVLRLLDKNALRPSIDTLGLLENDLRLLKEKLAAPYGLIMISGPTGSGKTTTLYSCLSGMDKTKKNVLTVEDPVEYRLEGVHQMQANAKIGLTFASGLRTMLRQDPDVIMVGETRDGETAGMAVQAALTGHIVFSTIHTNDAAGVITRLLDMGVEPFLVATSLTLAIAQRLVRTICNQCRIHVGGSSIIELLERDGVTEERLQSLGIEIDPELEYAQGAGCERCRNTGYEGRQAVFEMYEMTQEARDLILSPNLSASSLKKLARDKGMTTLISHGVQLVEDEVTTFQEVVRVLGEEQ